MALDNISDRIQRVRATRFVEAAGLTSYEWVCAIPAYALIEEVLVQAEAGWEDDVSAVLNVGLRSYEWDPLQSKYVVDEFEPDSVYSAELTTGPETEYVSLPVMDLSAVPREVVATVTPDECDGATGRTVVIVKYVQPVFEAPSVTGVPEEGD